MFPKNIKWRHILWAWMILFVLLPFFCFLFLGIEYLSLAFFFFIVFTVFSGASFWYIFQHLYSPFHQWLLTKNLYIDQNFVHPSTMLKSMESLWQNRDSIKEQYSQKEKECEQLRLEKEQLEKKYKEAYKQSEFDHLLLHQTLSHIEHGVCFIGLDGNVLPNYSPSIVALLEESVLAGRSILSLLFPWQPDLKKLEIFKKWLNRVLESDLTDWKENPVPFQTLLWKKEDKGKLISKNFKIRFAPIVKDDIVKQIVVFLQEVVQEKTSPGEAARSESHYPTLEYAMEILKAENSLRKDFFEQIENKIAAFEEKQALLQQGTLNRLVILDLSNCIKDIKSSARIVKFRSIVQESEKIETLLNILRVGQKTFRIEQLLEIEERTRKFLEILKLYLSMGKQIS